MENADSLQGSRTRGEYVLSGHVRFHHGKLRFETEKAVWQRDQNKVFCEKGMRITQNGSKLTADRGSYDKAGNRATADGHVFMRDSSGEVEAEGGHLTYDRVGSEAVLTGSPVARRIYPVKAGDTVKSKEPDTLAIRGNTLRYRDSLGIADANGDVVITRHDLHITCGRAEYRKRSDSLFLSQDPKVKVDESEVKGVLMRLGLNGEELRGMMVKGKAEALSVEKATDTTHARKSHVEGDSLFIAFKKGTVESVQVFRRATSTYFDVERPQYVNRMNGDYMVLRFQDRHVHDAEVLGSPLGAAKSTYYHFEKDTLKGKNLAQGDKITFGFKDGKIDEVMVKGSASGVYQGKALGKTKKDSVNTRNTVNAKTKVKP